MNNESLVNLEEQSDVIRQVGGRAFTASPWGSALLKD